jgi:hypothetical protein
MVARSNNRLAYTIPHGPGDSRDRPSKDLFAFFCYSFSHAFSCQLPCSSPPPTVAPPLHF